ncbi:PREDICTED: nuclease EXOG, mitochondrial-like [Amphimedon queenslandica]|uniref:Endonuclease n=1 Tax=Amphimedon queenslandica TaxID=400682 RepID=A0A1X7VGK7_AMPQE|nr:PREDICTED: nuclease EXOG, mitochondrial-like [Amphimedon queenslandica]|eukprot:XP_019849030.1 PREDICTED: nuclease EXOG, mitochondrial-like [Amphimedon queenslandica]
MNRIAAFSIGAASGVVGTYLTLKEREDLKVEPKVFKYGRPDSPVSFHSYSAHSLAYDRARKIPLWVIERLSPHDIKKEITADRHRSNFQPDPFVSPHYSSANTDYFNSGWSRGHMAAAGNYKHDQKCMDDTFYLTNILPQDLDNNIDYWYRLENYCRQLVKKGYSLTVISGPLFLPEERDGKKIISHQVIGDNNVSVPTHLFKILLAEREDEEPPLLGSFIIPNKPVSDCPLRTFQVPLETIEKHSGSHFLQNLQRNKALDLCDKDGCKTISLNELTLYRYAQKLEQATSKEALEKLWAEMESKAIKLDKHITAIYKKKMNEF